MCIYRRMKEMAKKRRQMKKNKKKELLTERIYDMLIEMNEHQSVQDRCQNRFYEEMCKVRQFRKNMENESKKYAMLRDCMVDNITFDKETEKILKPYVEQLDFFLEQKGFRILKAKEGDDFDPKIHKPVARVEVDKEELHGKIASVYQEGYWMEDEPAPFQKIMVDVYVYVNPLNSQNK